MADNITKTRLVIDKAKPEMPSIILIVFVDIWVIVK
jgi:hypothetical protein